MRKEDNQSLNGVLPQNTHVHNGIIQSEDECENCETSSAKCNQGHFVTKLRKGFFNKVNYFVSRFFMSKL